MGKYSSWVKKAEAPDIENYYTFEADRRIKAVKNLLYCLFMFSFHVLSGCINSPSSHSFLVFLPYACIFLPFAFLICASCRLFFLPDTLTKKQWEKSLGNMKHSGTALIFTSGLCTLCEIVFLILHFPSLRENVSLSMEISFCALQIILLTASVLYGFFYDKNFSGK